MKQILKWAILSTVIQAATCTVALAQAKTGMKKPNIILIVADDLGYADIGCYGQQKINTPNIDDMAKKGLSFTQFYAGTAVCAPSRASLMTGKHTGHTPVRGNKGTKPEGQFPLPDTIVTIASVLQQQGYTTAAFGKWGLGFITTPGDPEKQGFDNFYGYNCQTLAHNYYPDHLWNNHTRIELPGNLKSDSVYAADDIQEHALQFLKEKHNKPYFVYLPYTLPHGDLTVPHDSVYNYYVSKFNEEPLKQNLKSNDNEKHRFDPYPHAAFAAMVARLDRYVGEVMDALRKSGDDKNTLVMFTSDNGPHRENGGDPVFFNSSGKFKGIKRDLYEGGIRVPFIASWTGKIKPGSSEQEAAFWDLFPTFQQLAGIQTSPNLDGISILPTLTGGKPQPQHKYYYWEFHESGGRQAVRMGDWKAVKLNVSKDPKSVVELYNLKTDPGEKNNVAGQNPVIVKQMEEIISKEHVSDKNWPLLYNEIEQSK